MCEPHFMHSEDDLSRVLAGRYELLWIVAALALALYLAADYLIVAGLGEHAVNQPGAIFQAFAINVKAEHFQMDEEGRLRRAALSRAINRQEICGTLDM